MLRHDAATSRCPGAAGRYPEHLAALRDAGRRDPVRRRSELDAVDGLVIPAGNPPR
ncbi:hypothetical protein I553_3578 [Mycobacterium xenopi 4042]|uniref:Uncharacterized protein n=1 Tax=Mycobacterium xenopi 4042 TaxID=1299334 RepID=X8DIE8_MYCXE|nr:hypothetical protein I553_3578 [Mycobacterium xenopi 4042]